VDNIYRKISVYEDDMFRIRNDTGMECLPYPTFDDMIRLVFKYRMDKLRDVHFLYVEKCRATAI